MRRVEIIFVMAALIIVSCSRESSKSGRTEKTTNVEGGNQSLIADTDAKQPDPAEVEKELKRLEGVWHEVSTEMDGKRGVTPPDDDFMSILTFKGDEMSEKKKGDEETRLSRSGKIRIDPTKTPKRLEFFISGTKGSAKEVYELNGDELKTCSILSSNSFASEITGKKPQHLLVIYKRAKK